MTTFQEDLLTTFHDFLGQRDITPTYNTFTHTNRIYEVYSVPYSADIVSFIALLTNVTISDIKQYMAINQFLFLLRNNYELTLKVNLIVSLKSIEFAFKNLDDVSFEFDNPTFLSIKILNGHKILVHNKDSAPLSTKHSLENSYNKILHEIQHFINPSIKTFKQVLDRHNKDILDVLYDKISSPDVKVMSFDKFNRLYKGTTNTLYDSVDAFDLEQKAFNQFFKDNFSTSYCNKIKAIISLACFIDNLHKKSVDWDINCRGLTVQIPHISKYAEIDTMYSLSFGVMPNDDYRCTLDINVDGSVYFHYCVDGILRALHDLDSVYNYLKDEFINIIAKKLDVNQTDMRLSHLKVYEMILL